jgi:hypothetical protein
MKGATRISKWLWTRAGGLSNPRLFRLFRGGSWQYWEAA